MSVFPLVSLETDDPIVKQVFDRLRQRWGGVLNLYRVLGWAPALSKGWAAFAWTMRFELEVPRKLRELLVIRIASLAGARYEYVHHLKMAKEAGVTEGQITHLHAWRSSELFDERERLVLQLADELASVNGATPDTMARLQQLFRPRHLVELVVTGAFYCGVARVVNSFGVELEEHWEGLRVRND
jgi:alkylhydroperoxidase family enzyme